MPPWRGTLGSRYSLPAETVLGPLARRGPIRPERGMAGILAPTTRIPPNFWRPSVLWIDSIVLSALMLDPILWWTRSDVAFGSEMRVWQMSTKKLAS